MTGAPHVREWIIAQAWDAAVAVTAAAYRVDPAVIRAESRGRGPRPLAEAWEPKKMAVHLAVMASGCSYAALGRLIGLHRDTVASHCASMRNQVLDEASAETASAALEKLVKIKLRAIEGARIDALRAHLAQLEEIAGTFEAEAAYSAEAAVILASSDAVQRSHPTVSGVTAQDHGNVIALIGTRRKTR